MLWSLVDNEKGLTRRNFRTNIRNMENNFAQISAENEFRDEMTVQAVETFEENE